MDRECNFSIKHTIFSMRKSSEILVMICYWFVHKIFNINFKENETEKGIKLEERNKFNADCLYTKRTFKFPANSLSELYILKQEKLENRTIFENIRN